jgi:glycosyltransferase involved in cell wall biosynthesis
MLVKYGICRREKIFIAPNGHEHALRRDAKWAEIPLLRVLRRPYVLLLGSSAKHKNVHVILEQARGIDAAGIDIVVVGGASSIFSANAPDYQRASIHYAGYVGDDDLAALYEGALCLAFPSKTEGFGIPPLEAMARGCPVICSNASSLIEVGGNAVLMWIPTTAMAGGTRSLAWLETRIFARSWRRRAERDRRCFPGNAAHSFTLMKSCVYRLAVSELPAPDQPRQGSPHREAYSE